MADRSSRPHTSPAKTSPELERQIVRLRWRHRLGPVQIAGRLGIQASTVHAVLVRCRINRLSRIDRVTGEPLRRYEPRTGTAFVHTVIDDHSRAAYAEICADAKATTAIGVLLRAVAWFTDRGVTIERVLSDNGSAYKSYAWRDACTELGITHKRTRPYRPQTNGKIERFHRTLATDPTPPSEANPPSPD